MELPSEATEGQRTMAGLESREESKEEEREKRRKGWMQFLETVWQEPYTWHENDALELAERFELQYMCLIHCETKLIHYLGTDHVNQWDNVPAFSYIGASKLSCGACHMWIDSFNQLGGRRYYTRGSHGKWYWPWGLPIMGTALDKVMVKELLEAYKTHEMTSGRLRSQSESTGVSPFGAQHNLSEDHQREVAANIRKLKKAFGGSMLRLFRSKFPGA